MGSHMRLMDPSDPPWLLNQSVKLTLSRARTLRMPPSGSTRALTMGDVPSANEFAACTNTGRSQVREVCTAHLVQSICKGTDHLLCLPELLLRRAKGGKTQG